MHPADLPWPGTALCPRACSAAGWHKAEKALFDVQNLSYKLKGNNVPMPSTLVKHLLRIFIPDLIHRRLQALLPKELGSYLMRGALGWVQLGCQAMSALVCLSDSPGLPPPVLMCPALLGCWRHPLGAFHLLCCHLLMLLATVGRQPLIWLSLMLCSPAWGGHRR